MRFSLLLLTLLIATPLAAEVVPAFPIQSHAVLQRDKPIPVWGTAAPGEKVAVTFAGKTTATTADKSGAWRVDLPALPATSKPADLVIAGTNTITLTDIVVGEVWLASGQSNMEQMVDESFDASLDIPSSVRFPLIRHLKVENQGGYEPMTTAKGAWQLPSAETTGGFTAIGWYFALALHHRLDVPIGIIHSSRGGSRLFTWMDPAGIEADPEFKGVFAERKNRLAEYPAHKAKLEAEIAAWETAKKAAETAKQPFNRQRPNGGWAGTTGGPDDMFMPFSLYNGQIHPLVPYAMRGAIWYQGEGDSGNHAFYAKGFPALITGWRKRFAQGDFPFYWVQLCNYGDPAGTNTAFLREAQTKTLSLPNTGQAISIDLGQMNQIHPKRKQEVGRRLARLALNRTYGQKITDSGPQIEKVEREGAGYRIRFASPRGGSVLCAFVEPATGFELAGEDRVFKPAIAVLGDHGKSLLVTSAEVPAPVAIRYAWRDFVIPGIVHEVEGLPLAPFRSDDWSR